MSSTKTTQRGKRPLSAAQKTGGRRKRLRRSSFSESASSSSSSSGARASDGGSTDSDLDIPLHNLANRVNSSSSTPEAERTKHGKPAKHHVARSTAIVISPTDIEELSIWRHSTAQWIGKRLKLERKKLDDHFNKQRAEKKSREDNIKHKSSLVGAEHQAEIPAMLTLDQG